MTVSKKWNIVCQTDSHVETISASAPTECPNGAGHTIGDVTYLGEVVSICKEFDCGGTGKDGNFMLLVIGTDEDEDTGFVVPDDFGTLISLKLVGYAIDGTAFGAGKDIDLTFEYAGDGELRNANSYSEDEATYTTGSELDEWFEIDFTALAPDLTAGDRCCLNIEHQSVGGNIGYKAIIMEYYPA